jgi:putative peptidoglycan lipid II flippase
VTHDGDGSAAGARTVAAGVLVSRATGFVRNWAFARWFGAAPEADAFNAALKIPNLVRNLLGEGSISASFIPVYSAALARGDTQGARALANAVLGLLLAATAALTLLGIWAAPTLTTVLVAGFDADRIALTTRLLRVLFPMTGLMVLSAWALGVQNSHRRFFVGYAAAALWNITQIALLLVSGPRAPDLVTLAWWLAWATLIGAALQVAAQLPEVVRLVRPLRPTLAADTDGVGEVGRQFVPVVVALSAFQFSSFIDLQIASWLPVGSAANLGYATTIYLVPTALFGLSISAASLPEFSRDHAGAAYDALRERLRRGWARLLFYIVPSAVVFIAYGDLVASLLLQSGRFGEAERRVVHGILAGYGVGLAGVASVRLFASAHYALRDYRTPLRAALAAVLTGALVSLSLVWPVRERSWAIAAVALGASAGAWVNLGVLARSVRRRLGGLADAALRTSLRRSCTSALVAVAAAAPVRFAGFGPFQLKAFAALAVFGAAYLFMAFHLGSGEAERWLRAVGLVRRPA